ncbi:aromatic acid exporter family protein [Acholeplasma sp. OttesenSCG-928-E16]|nr:aromatic acid exporter family protein [Acholeplasma sp. OttesenSCG-928-E16]
MTLKTRRILITSIKMALACLGGTLIARAFNLDNYLTCGVIAVLSIHYSKRESYVSAVKRFLSAIFGIFFSTLMFFLVGYNITAYIIFVLIFALISWLLKVPEGIVPSIVLVTHLYTNGSLSWSLILNEVFIVLIAILVALLLNVIDTFFKESKKNIIINIDSIIRETIVIIKNRLQEDEKNDSSLKIDELKINLDKIYDELLSIDNDEIINKDHYNIDYAIMRKNQFKSLLHIIKMLNDIEEFHENSYIIANYFSLLSENIGKANMATFMKDELENLKTQFKNSPLPQTRDEFETRAVLFQILNEVENFLSEKIEFHNIHDKS